MRYFNKTSSSFHVLNGDKKLNLFEKCLWFLFNFLNNKIPNYKTDKYLSKKLFQLPKINTDFIQDNYNKSPSRILSNLFFLNYDWKNIEENFGKIKVLDIGCGRGDQLQLFNKVFGENFIYVGIDKKERSEWLTLKNDRIRFFTDDYLNFSKYLDDTNVIFSQSALEHLEQDVLLFDKISKYLMENQQKKMLNLHFFPSEDCIYTFRGHGIRQYGYNSVSKLTKNFNKNSIRQMFFLGNIDFNNLHKQKFNRDFFKKKNINDETYLKNLQKILKENKISTFKNSSFNVLEIKTNFN
mgnify:CR=1 FL=1|tara:strand:+ start:106 stop:993 length:888 start_codon:yes stop_codon:yes gene_type:complete